MLHNALAHRMHNTRHTGAECVSSLRFTTLTSALTTAESVLIQFYAVLFIQSTVMRSGWLRIPNCALHSVSSDGNYRVRTSSRTAGHINAVFVCRRFLQHLQVKTSAWTAEVRVCAPLIRPQVCHAGTFWQFVHCKATWSSVFLFVWLIFP